MSVHEVCKTGKYVKFEEDYVVIHDRTTSSIVWARYVHEGIKRLQALPAAAGLSPITLWHYCFNHLYHDALVMLPAIKW